MFSYSVLAVVAGLFALGYYPALTYFSLNFVSPYARADIKKRAFAATIDGLLVATSVLLYQYSGAPVCLVAGVGYLVERDAVRGQSLGKFCLGLVVISVETGRPGGAACSARRNLLFLVPGANLAAVALEAFTVVKDPQGQRLGDRMAQTQVVEGLGAKDIVRSLQEWWRDFLGELRPFPSRPRHVPADRCSAEAGKGFTHHIGDIVTVSTPALGALVNRVNHSDKIAPWTFGVTALIASLVRRGIAR